MDDSSILIIGANGQLGLALKENYPNAVGVDTDELDITSEQQVSNFDFSPFKVIINAAAYTNVDGAETDEGRVLAWKVNAQAISILTKAIANQDKTFVHISTDYVFDGSIADHKENEPLSPLGVYGQSKAAGDLVLSVFPKFYILRTSWVIGEGKNFVKTMLDLGKKGINPKVVSDVIGRPTFTTELVRVINHLLTTNAEFGIYNFSNGGEPVSWADLARAVFQVASLSVTVTDTTDKEYYADKPDASPRPMNSVFDLSKVNATNFSPRDWRESLEEYVKKELAKQ
ncbi:MAG: SDR family oxidoreductase [Candidatus Saccharimonadales bacterium]